MNETIIESICSLNSRRESSLTGRLGADCSQILDIGFFFDGISKNLEADIQDNKVSNVGSLFLAYPPEEEGKLGAPIRRHYYSGLGTSFDSSLSENMVGAAHRVPSEAVGTGEGQLRSSGTDAAKDVLSGGGSGRWYEVFGRSLKVSITQPWNWVKAARDAAIRTGIEAAAPVRDTSIAANLLMSGSHTRLSSAVRDFHNSVADVKQNSELPLARIRVSVFGFDFGAAMAKAFVRRLLDEVCDQDGERFVYQDSDVEVVFVGLLDCVDRTHAEMGLLDWFHPLSPVLDDGGELHPGCQRALHLVAAHERRFYRRCRPLGRENPQWHEELCPGISEDIGGGLVADEQKASAELSRAALHRMYRRATIAGVPFPPLDTLKEQNEFTAQWFELNDEIEGYSLPALARHYQRYTNSRRSPTGENFRLHTLVYLAWLAQRYRDYQDTLAALEAREDDLPNRYYHRTIGSLVASVSGSQEEWSIQTAERAEIDEALSALKQAWGWLDDVDSEAKDIRRRERSSDRNTYLHARATLRNHSQLANSWYQWTREESPPELPEPVGLLFAYGLHDKQPEEMTYRNRQPSQLVGGYRFMTWRGIDQP
ncbi:hypothetical protein LCGC14_0159640 [marine sediment metagenome]|uniref:DUF2235 domain-containing protein n=1 Tax=marine sediment metagenome TaxID=412755 RepID=A0A0F9UW90_9ZZZZ|nr:DUF2235 domain-containing protein [Halomonas sp.]HDZ46649.1 DUF2235 domain-containing protein [Halomonas sp.]HEB06413.1 DUF2235 domain-containing protein [Halomonas sp.]